MPSPQRGYVRPYLDSSVYIAAIRKEHGRVEVAEQILEDARAGKLRIIASTFVAAEVIRAKGQPDLRATTDETIAQYLMHEYITWVELDLTLALEARQLARLHGLKPADAVHLASAIRGGADQLLRWNGRFGQAGLYEGVYVCEPYPSGQGTLFQP